MKILKSGIVARVTDSFFSYHAWPSVCRDEKGNIYVVCSGLRMGHMCPFGKIVMYKSRDGGETFGLPTVISDHYLDDRDPGLLYLGEGKMLVTRASHSAETYIKEFADWIYSDSGEAGKGMLKQFEKIPEEYAKGGCFYRFVYDYGEKAGDEKPIPIHCPHGPAMLRDGSILYLGKAVFAYGTEIEDRFFAYKSNDKGETFNRIGELKIPEGYELSQFHEAHCAQLPDGRIMGLLRTHLTEDDNYFTITKTFSEDGGKTWSTPELTGICGSPPHLCVLTGGKAALTYGRRIPPYGIYGRQVSGTGEISEDEFKLAECFDDDIGYPATVQLADGTLFTVYYARCKGDDTASLQYVKWNLE